MPVIAIARCVQSLMSWVYFVTFIVEGVPYDYAFDIGSVMMSEEAAQALVQRSQYMHRAQLMFLSEVHLNTEIPN